MRIGAKVNVFNFKMRKRRKELNLTQQDLADLVNVSPHKISLTEILEPPYKGTSRTKDLLKAIAMELDMDFDILFPEDYLIALERKMRPRYRRTSLLLLIDVSLEQLSSGESIPQLIESTTEDEILKSVDNDNLVTEVEKILDTFDFIERRVLELRFGLNREEEHTLEGAGKVLGLHRERIRQIEAKALRKCRHPTRNHKLRPFLYEGKTFEEQEENQDKEELEKQRIEDQKDAIAALKIQPRQRKLKKMIHPNRDFAVSDMSDDLESLAHNMSQITWCLCSSWKVDDFLLLNDSFSEDGASEFAICKILKTDGDTTEVEQIESVTFSWFTVDQALDYLIMIKEGKIKKPYEFGTFSVKTKSPRAHGSCYLCR